MSRIGRHPIAIPAGVTVTVSDDNHVVVKGPKGQLEQTVNKNITVKVEGNEVHVTRRTMRSRIALSTACIAP